MKPFYIALIGCIVGIIIGLYLNSIALFILLFILLICFLNKKYILYALTFLICFCFFYGYILVLENNANKIYKDYGECNVKIQGTIISNPIEKEYKTTYEIKVTKIENLEKEIKTSKNFNVLCNIKRQKDDEVSLKYGDEIELECIYELPNQSRNEGGFDYRKYLKAKNILGIVNISKSDAKLLEKSNILISIHSLKNYLIKNIKNILNNDSASLCIGLLLGDKTLISEDIQNNFRQSSLSHILAISGAHVSYILLGITALLNILKLHKRWSKILIIIFLLFFLLLIEFTPSVARAVIMVILTLICQILFKKPDTMLNLAISSFIILLVNPYYLLDVGFELSFGGTLSLILFMKRYKVKPKNKILNYIKQTILVSISANIIIIPIMMYYFNTISATFIISNVLATPILALALILGLIFIIFLLICRPIAILISYLLNIILQALIIITKITSKIPFSQILLPTPKLWQIILYYLIILIFFYHPKFIQNRNEKYKKLIAFILIFLLISPYFIKIPSPNLKIFFIDVGQGDSMLINTPSGKTILVDGGGSEVGSFDVGENILLPFLLDKNIMTIDYMMFSHFDSDHCEGLLTILNKLKVKNIIISKQGKISDNFKKLLEILKLKKVNIIVAKAGKNIVIDNKCYINILFPEDKLILENTLNNNSIVAKFCYQTFSILLTGDIEKASEKRLVELYKNNLQATVLKVAHHGSKTSTTAEFLQMVKPKIALIGVGKDNKFGHPNNETIKSLTDAGVAIYRTDEMGEITINVNSKNLIKIKKLLE